MQSPNAGHDYVITVIRRPYITNCNLHSEILTILKDRPAWQKGRLNLPGGRVEAGETPEMAAIREVKEETGYEVMRIKKVGVMNDGMFRIHILKAAIDRMNDEPVPRESETEIATWYPLSDLMQDSRLLPNLRAILPLVLCGVEDFMIDDVARSEYGPKHNFVVTVPTHRQDATGEPENVCHLPPAGDGPEDPHLDFEELSYSSSEVVTIELTQRYSDEAVLPNN